MICLKKITKPHKPVFDLLLFKFLHCIRGASPYGCSHSPIWISVENLWVWNCQHSSMLTVRLYYLEVLVWTWLPKVRKVLWKCMLCDYEGTCPLKTHSIFTLVHILWDFVCTEVWRFKKKIYFFSFYFLRIHLSNQYMKHWNFLVHSSNKGWEWGMDTVYL